MPHSLPKDVATLSDEAVYLIFEQAQRKLECIDRDTDALDKKGFALITTLLAISGAIIALSPHIESTSTHWGIGTFILVLGIIASLIFLFKAISTSSYFADSFNPSQILDADDSCLKSKNDILRSFLISWYDLAIEHNLKENKKKGCCLNNALLISFCCFSVTIFILILSGGFGSVWLRVFGFVTWVTA